MANRFALTGNWSSTGSWSTTSGGASGASVPTASDDVIFDSHSGAFTIDAASSCRSLDCTAGTGNYTGTLTHNAFTLSIGTSTVNASNVALKFVSHVTGMTYTLANAATSAISFVSTSATQTTILTAGQVLGNVTFNGAGGSWLQSDAITATGGTLTLSSGSWATGSFSVSALAVNMSGSTARTFTPGASTFTLSQLGTVGIAFNATTNTLLTVSANTAVIVSTGAGGAGFNNIVVNSSFVPNGMSAVATGSGTVLFNISGTWANVVRAGTATKTDGATFAAPFTVTGTLALQGNSATNRLLISSSALGTQRTITDTGASWTASVTLAGTTYQTQNVDLMDIKSSTGTIDLSGITGNSGDCQGNTGITFTTPASQTYTDVGIHSDNWSTLARWTSRVPLPQDNVSVPLGSTGTITVDMPRMGKNVDFTGITGTVSFAVGTTGFGNWTFGAGMSIGTSSTITLGGRGSQTITHNGKSWPGSVVPNAVTGTYTMQDALQCGPTGASNCNPNTGSFSTGGFTVTCSQFIYNGTATLTITNSTILCNLSVAAGFFTVLSTGATVNAAGSTIVLNSASTATRTFTTSGKTFGTLQYTVSGSPGALVVTGTTPTFANITITTAGNAPKTLTLPSSTTTTVTGVFTLTGTAVSGYVYLPGIAGIGISTGTPASVSTATTSVRLTAHIGNTSPGQTSVLVAANPASDANRGTRLVIDSANTLVFQASKTGASFDVAASATIKPNTIAAALWLRGTMALPSGNVTFETSPDNVTWTQLGTVVNGPGSMTLEATTFWSVGAYQTILQNPYIGQFYAAKAELDGVTILSPDFTTTATGMETSYTDAQSHVWTVNGAVNSNVYLNSSTPGTQHTLSMPGTATVNVGPNVQIQDSNATGGASFLVNAGTGP